MPSGYTTAAGCSGGSAGWAAPGRAVRSVWWGRTLSAAVVATAAGLMGVGAVMSFSATASVDASLIGWPFWHYPAMRQLVFLTAAMIAMIATSRLPCQAWTWGRGTLAWCLLGLGLGLSALVFVPGIGVEVNNAWRWIQIGPAQYGLRLQPSEVVKIALPLFLAVWFGYLADARKFWTGFLPAVLAIGACVGMVGPEDFGTAALLVSVGGAMLVVAGVRWWSILMLIGPVVPAFFVLLHSRAHRMERLVTFAEFWRVPADQGFGRMEELCMGPGYQAMQSLCTIANGGLWGQGLGGGVVKSFLPAARTDFVFAVICEELGLIGAAAVIGLLAVLVWNGHAIFSRCGDTFGRFLAFGLTLTLGVQAAMNVAVVTVTAPTKGIALPLVSAGGSGAIFIGVLVGILASIPKSAPLRPELSEG